MRIFFPEEYCQWERALLLEKKKKKKKYLGPISVLPKFINFSVNRGQTNNLFTLIDIDRLIFKRMGYFISNEFQRPNIRLF